MGANTTSRRVRPARGYVVAGRVAADQLRGGRPVVADVSTAWLPHVRGRGSVARECGVPIHIVVENGHVTLEGFVSTEMQKNIAGIQANSVSGTFSVTNNLRIDDRK